MGGAQGEEHRLARSWPSLGRRPLVSSDLELTGTACIHTTTIPYCCSCTSVPLPSQIPGCKSSNLAQSRLIALSWIISRDMKRFTFAKERHYRL